MYNNDAHNNYLWWAGLSNENTTSNTFEYMYGLQTGDRRHAATQPTQNIPGYYHYNASGDSQDALSDGPAKYQVWYQNVAWALPYTDDYSRYGDHGLVPVINWPTKNAFMGIWTASEGSYTIQDSNSNGQGGYNKIRSQVPRYYDAQGSPMHLADICRQILRERHGDAYADGFNNEPGAMALLHGLNDQGYAVFMHGNQGLEMSDATNTLGSSTTTFDKINALTLHDLRFYMRAGENMSYRPHLSISATAYNISGLYQDFEFSPTGNVYGDQGATFVGSWTSVHSDSFTADKTVDVDSVGFYLDGSGETDGSPTGDYWQVDRDMTSTLNQFKTYEIWLKPARADRQSLFYGSGTIQHVEIYPNSLNFRTEATLQNGKSFGANHNTGVDLGEFRLVDGRDARNGFAVNQWNCLTITFNTGPGGDGTVKWYCNGYHFHTGNMYNGTNGVNEYFSFMGIGRATGSSSYLYAKSFQGRFDEFKIYDSVLNQTQIENNVRSSRHFVDYYNGSDKLYEM